MKFNTSSSIYERCMYKRPGQFQNSCKRNWRQQTMFPMENAINDMDCKEIKKNSVARG